MNTEKIMTLFHGPMTVVNVGPKLFAEAIAQQDYPVVQVNWQPTAGGDEKMQKILALLGGLE